MRCGRAVMLLQRSIDGGANEGAGRLIRLVNGLMVGEVDCAQRGGELYDDGGDGGRADGWAAVAVGCWLRRVRCQGGWLVATCGCRVMDDEAVPSRMCMTT